VDDILVYPYALTYPQVQELYAGTAPVIETPPVLPLQHRLVGNYPNPFNGETILRFHVGARTDVKLGVFDMLGRRVAVLVDEIMEAGVYSVRFDAANLASGFYLCRLTSGSISETRRMVLMR
jgi:hypothetical protein